MATATMHADGGDAGNESDENDKRVTDMCDANDIESADVMDLQPSRAIRALHNLIGRYWNASIPQDSGMSGSNTPIILYLHDHRDDDVFQYDIERAFSITRSTASRVLSLMEKKGLVERTGVDWDARVRKITLTDAATDYAVRFKQAATNLERILFAGFSPEERSQAMDMLLAMRRNLIGTGLVGTDHATDAVGSPPQPTHAPPISSHEADETSPARQDNTKNTKNTKKGDDAQ
ncbi:MarR family winged helix-turn-helix transcriptional regulator [Bifidobacterium cuniculi]|uniref:MarR-type transcriptional regulator n=1 Tax=Bifidobacterium cuniculi TaxID=1688 RepID=A0A087AYL9_9BIFI|nr:MarR family winged helix-turn-helix transcriptional regulator [Bifidobacterium cuniculi]KFI63869.1 MarR-type transcriptional regulator [Bifidobacterium cuniculi]